MVAKVTHKMRSFKLWSAITGVALVVALVLTFLPYEASIDTGGILSISLRQTSANPGIGEFSYKKKLTFNTTAISVTTNQTNFPVCVHINSSSWTNSTERDNFFGAWNVGGKRCQFFDSDGTTNLDYEVELYNSGTPEAIYWVRVPQVDGNSTADYVWVAFGNDPNGTGQDNRLGVWDSNFKAVWHMADACPEYGFVTKTHTGYHWARAIMDGSSRYIVRADYGGHIEICSANSNWTVNSVISTSTFHVLDLRARIYSELNDHIIYGVSLDEPYTSYIPRYWTYNISTDTWASEADMYAGYPAMGTYYDGYFYFFPCVIDDQDAWYNHMGKCTPANWTTSTNWIKVDLPAYGSTVNKYFEVACARMGSYMYFKRESASTFWWDLYKWDFASTFTQLGINEDDTAVDHGAVIACMGVDLDHTIVAVALSYYNAGSEYWNIKYSTDGSIWTSIGTSFIPPNNGHENFCIPIPYDSTHIHVQCLDEFQTGYSAMYRIDGTKLCHWDGDLSSSMDSEAYFVEDGTRMVLSGQHQADAAQIHYVTNYETDTSSVLDSTSNGNHGTKAATPPTEDTGKVGKAQLYDGTNDLINTALNPYTELGNTLTLEALVYPHAQNNYRGVMGETPTTPAIGLIGFQYITSAWAFGYGDNAAYRYQSNLGALTLNTWAYLTGTITAGTGGNINVFKDGAQVGSPYSVSTNVYHYTMFPIGRNYNDTDRYFDGVIDEVRVSNVVRSAGWIKLTHYSMKKTNFNGDSWLSWGVQETAVPTITNSPDSNGFGVLAASATANTAINYFTITNTGGCAVDVTIQGTDLAGGDDTWDLADDATPGENIYGLYAGKDDADDLFDVIVRETATYNTLVSALAESATQGWGLKIYMPTSLSGYDSNQMSGNITLVASEAA